MHGQSEAAPLTASEVVSVQLPRCWPKGALPQASRRNRSKRAKEKGSSLKTYQVTIEHGASTKKAKQFGRTASSSVTFREPDPAEASEVEPGRYASRVERASRFSVGRQFPALINPQMLPGSRVAQAGHDIVGTKRQNPTSREVGTKRQNPASREALEQLTKPTIASEQRQQEKRPEAAFAPWLYSGQAEVGALISDRQPSLYEGEYDAHRIIARDRYAKDKQRWLSPERTIIPAGKARSRSPMEDEIGRQREKGSHFKKGLEERYAKRRENYKANARTDSPFEVYARSQNKDASPKSEQVDEAEEEVESLSKSFYGLLTLRK